jgi:4-amino-4-deoxy-L-arabinose transferase-like glycosyltransferase
VLRLYKPGVYPQSFHHDEMMLGYDAWSIWKTGMDQHGAFLPIHFRAFNEYLSGTAQYIVAPFVGLLGPSETSARLPFALLGTLTVFITARIGQRWFGRWAGLLAALFLAIDPWHLFFSRLALVNSSTPIFTVAALYAFTRATTAIQADLHDGGDHGRSLTRDGPAGAGAARALGGFRRSTMAWLALSALFFAVLMRTYQPLRLQAPLLFVLCLVSAGALLKRCPRLLLLWMGLFALFASPQIIDHVAHWERNQLQLRHNNLLDRGDWLVTLVSNYADYYDPRRLFFTGLEGMVDSLPGIGNLFWMEGPLWLAAAYGLSRGVLLNRPGFSVRFLLVAWFFTYPLAASFTLTGIPSENRTVGFLPCPELLAGYGAMVVLNGLGRSGFPWSSAARRACAITALLVAVVLYESRFIPWFFDAPYRQTRRDPSSMPVSIGLREILDESTRRAQPCDVVYVDELLWVGYLFMAR